MRTTGPELTYYRQHSTYLSSKRKDSGGAQIAIAQVPHTQHNVHVPHTKKRRPVSERLHGCRAATLRTSIHIGETSYSAKAVHQIVSNMGQHYWGSRYHLLQMNCNHFSSDLCYELCGQRPPGWINRLAGVVVGLHCLIPVDWVPPLDTPSAPPSFAVTGSHPCY